jgi:protocatechuate 3,4-dioxygenase, alpha subunit
VTRRHLTPSQTVGPYLHIGLLWEDAAHVVPQATPGAIWLRGRLLDGNGEPVCDGLVETWQADGVGRCPTGPDGEWAVLTLKPGALPAPGGGLEAPHVDISVFARGLLDRVVTRLYFADEPGANTTDAVLSSLPGHRRGVLLAERTGDGYRLDLRLKGAGETVFFVL